MKSNEKLKFLEEFKKFVTENKNLIDNYQVKTIYNRLYNSYWAHYRPDSRSRRWFSPDLHHAELYAFSIICNNWIEAGYNPLEKMEIIPEHFFTYITTSKVIIPSNIKKIDDSAFEGTEFDTVIIEDGVGRIHSGAFYKCKINSIIIKGRIKLDAGAIIQSNIKQIEMPRSACYNTDWCSVKYNVIDKVILINK